MTEGDKDDEALDSLFASAKSAEEPSDQFMARLLADAAEAAAQNVPPVAAPTSQKRPSLWQAWLPVSGLTAATLAGVWIGVTLPHSDFGSEYLTAVAASDSLVDGFSPSFGVSTLLEDSE